MEIRIDKSFERDIKKIKESNLRERVVTLIETIEEISHLNELPNAKKIKGFPHYYRIRVGDYRIGIELEGNACVFLRILHREDIYKYFP